MIGACDDEYQLLSQMSGYPHWSRLPAPPPCGVAEPVTAQAIVSLPGPEAGFWLESVYFDLTSERLVQLVAQERSWYATRGVRPPFRPGFETAA